MNAELSQALVDLANAAAYLLKSLNWAVLPLVLLMLSKTFGWFKYKD